MENIKVKGPVIIAMNHPNAFTDPILITSLTHPMKLKFMARGDVFKPGLITSLLESIGIVPIFRIQDGGKEGLKKNEDAYRRVNYLLSKNSKIIVFAEGLCIQERRLRPLKKGVARMVFGAFEAINNEHLVVVPIGVNYSNPSKLRSNAFYNIGEPIRVREFIEAYRNNPARANRAFMDVLEPRMKALVTHIQNPDDDEAVLQVETLCKRAELLKQQLNPTNLEHDFRVLQQLTEKVNAASLQNREVLGEFKTQAKAYFDALRAHNLRDWLFDPSQNAQSNPIHLVSRCFALLAGAPIWALAMIGNYLPFLLTNYITKKIVKNIEFFSSFYIGIAMIVFLIYYVLCFITLNVVFASGLLTFLSLFAFGLSAWFSLYYVPFFKKTRGMFVIQNNKVLVAQLSSQRNMLLALINKL
ncbi:MAG: 1-acyl-sn-glycerol-3-phosphate acyltransferase [bacterium]|nr:1-acyl-sn-glycerol-3-phosphate acyltransferase [bacterium]